MKYGTTIALTVFVSTVTLSTATGATTDDPPGCRGGPGPIGSIHLARVTRSPAADMYWDYTMFRSSHQCPAKIARCKSGSIAAGEDVILSDAHQPGYDCAFHFDEVGGRGGWIAHDDLEPVSISPDSAKAAFWLGDWGDKQTRISISSVAGGLLSFTGRVVGPDGQRGYFAGVAEPREGIASITGSGELPNECAVTLQLLGRFLVVSDNHECSGFRVSFKGVYVRRHAV